MKDFSKPFDELRSRRAEEMLLSEIDSICRKRIKADKKRISRGSIGSITFKRKINFNHQPPEDLCQTPAQLARLKIAINARQGPGNGAGG